MSTPLIEIISNRVITVKHDPDWEGQIEIKNENIIPEYVDIKEFEEESANRQEFKIKIEKCCVDDELADLPQECIKDDENINRGDHENFDYPDEKGFDSSIGILGSKDPLEYSGQEFKIKIENCSVDELEDHTQEFIKDEDINGGDHDFDCTDDKDFDSSIGILGSKDSLECQYSGYNCNDVTNMENNVMVAHDGENIPSSNINEMTSNTNVNRKPQRVMLYKCQHCDFQSPQMSTLTHHINFKHTREKIHKCEHCDYGSHWISALKHHINSKHTREDIHECEYCDYKCPLLANLKSHINSMHTREKIHKCHYCDYGSTHRSHLKSHINSIHTREKMHKCQYCVYKSAQLSSLKTHINSVHTREKVHKCEYCDYESTRISHLKTHVNSIHTKETIYKCDYCDYQSTRISNLKIHINCIHTREKLHMCQYCDYGNPQMSNLRYHIKSKHAEVSKDI